MTRINNKKFFYIILIIVIIFAIINYLKVELDRNERENFKIESISKVYEFKGASRSKFLNFVYFFENKKYKDDWYCGSHPKVKVGEFYKIIYSSKNPKNVEIFLDEKITDTVAILKAGFSREDIANMPK
jgi:YbbR domain-containing protein